MNWGSFLSSIKLSLPWQTVAAAMMSLIATLLLTPLARWCAHRTGVVDRPDGARKLQREPVALLGGVAVLGGLALTVFAAVVAGAMDNSLEAILLVSVGLSVLCAVGVVDDAYNLRAGWKLLAQIGATIPVVFAGCIIDDVNVFGFHIPLGPLGTIATLFWLVACTNAFNLIDGMDGLCSTVALCIAAAATCISLIAGAGNTVVCAAALAGSLAGFLAYNLPPARIYLGDAGSMVIGMTLGLLTLHVSQSETNVTYPLVMVSLMAVPLGDVTLAMIRRKLNGRPVFQPDRGHIHHCLLDRKLTVPQALLVIASLTSITGIIAVGAFSLTNDLVAVGSITMVIAVLVNRRILGHHEWALFREAVARRKSMQQTPPAESLPAIVRFDSAAAPALQLHQHKNTATTESEEPPQRRAA